VLERSRGLVAIAAAGLAVSVPLLFAGRALAGLPGIALALALSAALVLAALLLAVSGSALRLAAGGLALRVGALAAVSFGLGSMVGGVAGAALGLAVYGGVLAALRPQRLRDAWAHMRTLHP
jgi:hypothetical protein